MLSKVARRHRSLHTSLIARTVTTESLSPSSSSSTQIPLPTLTKHPSPKPRFPLNPAPRPARSALLDTSFSLPPTFGQNQLLPVSNSTRALLESIVAQFNAPIRYAFAYGSGVFEQEGYVTQPDEGKRPMLDFMFAVRHPSHWHSINMAQYPSHYPLHARMFGSDFVSRVQEINPGVWFNAFVNVNGVTIKYGVTSVDNICSDLLTWRSLYLAGRMHKPLRIIKDDARVRLTQQVNLTSALRAALLTLPTHFTESELFERIASISYDGDLRMLLPAENRSKVKNIVHKQGPQFKELYRRLAVGLPGVSWPVAAQNIEVDANPHVRAALLKKLPSTLLKKVTDHYSRTGMPSKEADESAFWVRLAGDETLPSVIRSQMRSIVRYPAAIQTAKGVVSAGVGKSFRYGSEKVGKWWKGTAAK
ncbi:Mmp37-domain-containing protein [Rickenella mellea]|uniref:Phosphatidate cytidylyltransferase, mitochondrial n=1 Tax=Rickenella mellea TaxID=50990 RepID=A0A4Y7Q3K5_9AGAM|nr:Mmp37-domain-containing protein [Rickenella mellea]